MYVRRSSPRAVVAVLAAGLAVLMVTSAPLVMAMAATTEPTEAPTTEAPTPAPTPAPTAAPAPPPAPPPTPSATPEPTEDPDPCSGRSVDDDAVAFGDFDENCDGTLLLSEQLNPLSLRRTLTVTVPADGATPDGEGVDDAEAAEDRFEPTDFVPGTLVEFDTQTRAGGTVREGSLIYTPPAGFTGQDRYTFFIRGGDGVTREVEVLTTVDEVEATTEEPSEDVTDEPTDEPTMAQDAVDRVLTEAGFATRDPRWSPNWLGIMTMIAVMLLGLAVAWWLLLIVRIQDRI